VVMCSCASEGNRELGNDDPGVSDMRPYNFPDFMIRAMPYTAAVVDLRSCLRVAIPQDVPKTVQSLTYVASRVRTRLMTRTAPLTGRPRRYTLRI
jgi:hypothetical protein